MGLIPNLSRADSKDFRVSSTPSLSSFVEFLEKLFRACSRLSTTGSNSFRSLSTPYLCAFSISAVFLLKALSSSALDLSKASSSSEILASKLSDSSAFSLEVSMFSSIGTASSNEGSS